MKMVLKVIGALLALVVVVAAGFALFIRFDWPVHAKLEHIELKVDATPERLARGKQLVSIRCAGCHYDQKTGAFTGQVMHDAPPEFGTIYSHNITKHPTKGLGRYSDGELLTLLRTGVRRDGVFSGPFMQAAILGDEDLYAIIAFLRSDDPWVAAKDVDDRQWEPTFLARLLMHVAFKPMRMPTAKIPVPDVKDQVAYGKYVVNGMGDCFVCHSADFKTLNAVEPEKSGGYLGGGNLTRDANGKVVRTANLTMDPETGIGKWSEDEFVRAVRTGICKDGRALRFPMVPYPELSEAETRAAFAFLKTVPPVRHAVERDFEPAAAVADGAALYHKYACVSCHGDNGVGVCDLRQASKKYETDDKLSAFLHDASKFVPGTKMPTWNGTIAEAEYPVLIGYIHSLEK
jgi:mono/diheme cytochrome c family protein